MTTSVYIKGPSQAIEVSEWIKHNLKDCQYNIDLNYSDPFNGSYKFVFESSKDATIVALKWGNNYERVQRSFGTTETRSRSGQVGSDALQS